MRHKKTKTTALAVPRARSRRAATALACGGLLTAAAAPCLAQNQDQQTELVPDIRPMETVRASRFKFLDLDGDGCLTRSEIPDDDPVLRSQFQTLDTDRNGCVSLDEYVRTALE